ncbi:MAG: hypothetical protein K2J95_09885 [Lachnospiraceae bacterium]|nr:hypothetical protein [Lachnospiraceae bacterium]
MEEEKKELKQESAAEEEKKIHKKIKKKFLLLIPILIALSIGLFLILRETGVINKYVYEEVGNLAEREGVCFDNLLFSYKIVVYCGDQREERWLCILNNGDVYAFEWNGESLWDWYVSERQAEEKMLAIGYNDDNWGKMENVVYLGRFSNGAVRRLNSYVDNFDRGAEYYYLYPSEVTVPQGGGGQEEKGHMDKEGAEDEEVEWTNYEVILYWHQQPKDWLDKHEQIEWCHMNPTWWGGYEKEILERSLDENAIAAIKLFESSGFYDRWVKMCLNGY